MSRLKFYTWANHCPACGSFVYSFNRKACMNGWFCRWKNGVLSFWHNHVRCDDSNCRVRWLEFPKLMPKSEIEAAKAAILAPQKEEALAERVRGVFKYKPLSWMDK